MSSKMKELPPRIHSFGPVADADARILILGSMPGKASLRADQYYAHPQNHFWRIIGELTGAGRELPYDDRLRQLKAAGIALWDVLASCERDSSLDADIRTGSMQVNDFGEFFCRHSRLRRVLFNGATAATTFHRLVLPGLSAAHLQLLRLPSTSPANAAMSYERKLQAWRQAITDEHCG